MRVRRRGSISCRWWFRPNRASIAYTSTSLAGARSAVNAGLGVTVLPREMVPAYLTPIIGDGDLPPLYDTEIALIEAPGLPDTAHRLAQHITAALERGEQALRDPT